MSKSKDIIKKQIDAYQTNFVKHGDTPQGTFQNNKITQHLRFENLIKELNINGDSVHDIGSGTCDLHFFMKEKNINHRYIGSEIVSEMVKLSKEKYPEVEVYERDILEIEDKELYDFTVLSGTFNLPGEVNRVDWEKFCFNMITKMFSTSKKAISFNFLTSYSTFTDESLFYMDPSKVFDFCMKNLSRYVFVNHGSPLYEYTITVFKKSFMSQKYHQDDLKKYFKNAM